MESLYVFLILNDVWIYILSILGLFWFISEYIRSRRILRQAMFGLEREAGARIRSKAIPFIVAFTLIIGVVYFVNSQIRPTLSEALFNPPTPTPDIFATPLSSPTPLGTAVIIQPSPTLPLIPTITLASQPGNPPPPILAADAAMPVVEPVNTPAPAGPTVTPFIGCTTNLQISQPNNGAFVSGDITFSGTVDTENFLNYRLEANGPQTNGAWASLLGRAIDQPVRDGFLGDANLSQWDNGPYLIRLTAVNTTQSIVGQCVIQITLNN